MPVILNGIIQYYNMNSSWVQTLVLIFTTHGILANGITIIAISLGYCEDKYNM